MNTISAALRVLFTITPSPQYVLARSAQKIDIVPVNPVSQDEKIGTKSYGRVSLSACADAIRRSSPEIGPDGSRDYSVYILDPLENVVSSNNASLPSDSAVAVGMGLMSSILALSSEESVLVNGTLLSDGHGDVALEVVMSLRQIPPPQPYPHSYHSLAPPYGYDHLPQQYPFQQQFYEQQRITPVPKPRTAMPSSSGLQPPFTLSPLPPFSDRMQKRDEGTEPAGWGRGTMHPGVEVHDVDAEICIADADAASLHPASYIGPPRRARGRPRLRKGVQEPGRLAARKGQDASATSKSAHVGALERPKTSEEKLQTLGLPLSPSTQRSASTLPDPNLLNTLISALSDNVHNPLILSAISSLSSTASENADARSMPNSTLIQLLKDLLAAATRGDPPEVEGSRSTSDDITLPGRLETKHILSAAQNVNAAPDVIIIDKENVNPRQKPSPSKSSHSAAKAASSSPLGTGGHNSQTKSRTKEMIDKASRHASRLDSSQHEPANPPSDSGKTPHDKPHLANMKGKKRTLNEVMEDLENSSAAAGSTPSAPGQRPWVGDGRCIQVNTGWGGLRMREDGTFSGGHRPKSPSIAASQNTITAVAASDPLNTRRLFRSSSTPSLSRQRSYVTPEWARGVPPPAPPVRPVDPQSALNGPDKGRRQGQPKMRSRLGGKAVVKRARDTNGGFEAGTSSKNESAFSLASNSKSKLTTSSGLSRSPLIAPLPICAQSSPTQKPFNVARGPFSCTSPCRPSSSFNLSNLPSTPLPMRPSHRNSVPGDGFANQSSLFTPSPALPIMSPERRMRSLYGDGSPLFSPSPASRKRKLPYSPTGKREKQLKSPIAEHDKSLGSPTARRNIKAPAFAEFPSSSLPIASSDGGSPVREVGTMVIDPSDQTAESTPSSAYASSSHKVWSYLELPPSSPPPPSSPALMPIDDMVEAEVNPDLDVPIADSDPPYASDAFISDDDPDQTVDYNHVSSDFFSEPASARSFYRGTDFSDMSDIFSDPAFSELHLTGLSSDEPCTEAAAQALQNGLGGEDLSEVWRLMSTFIAEQDSSSLGRGEAQQAQAWLGKGGGSSLFSFDDSDPPVVVEKPMHNGGEDPAIVAARNFEAILEGCLI